MSPPVTRLESCTRLVCDPQESFFYRFPRLTSEWFLFRYNSQTHTLAGGPIEFIHFIIFVASSFQINIRESGSDLLESEPDAAPAHLRRDKDWCLRLSCPCCRLELRWRFPVSCGISCAASRVFFIGGVRTSSVFERYLHSLYRDQKASVQTDEESNIFDIQKGSKQGDPLSSLLFNTVLQYSLKDEIQRWQKKKGMGIYLSDQDRDCLTNLRFADDVMLFATSKRQIQAMMCEFKEATKKVGLTIHPNKTKILSSESSMNPDTKRYMKIGDLDIEILAKRESVKYLGQRISFHQQETIEIKSRIRAAWATFRKYRQELTSKKYMLKLRLRLFDATVSPTLCYASGTWSPSREHERMIQRKMLRLIIQTKRKYKKIERRKVIEHTIEEENEDKTENCSTDDKSGDDQSTNSEDDMDSGATFEEDSEKDIDTAEIEEEDWFDYIRRSTADAIDRMDHAKIRCWNKTHKKMKWKLALRIATSPSERWVKKAAEWNPEMSSKYRTSRAIGRPKKRWEDDINDFLKQNHDETKMEETRERRIQNKNRWISTANDRKEWIRLEEKYTSQNAK